MFVVPIRMLTAEGLKPVSVDRLSYLSRSKLKRLPLIHRVARQAYYHVCEAFPSWLGMILMTAVKPRPNPMLDGD